MLALLLASEGKMMKSTSENNKNQQKLSAFRKESFELVALAKLACACFALGVRCYVAKSYQLALLAHSYSYGDSC